MAKKEMNAVARIQTPETGMMLLDVERAREILAECKSSDEAQGIRDKALAVAVYLRSKKAALSARNDAQEIAARAERRMGQILADTELSKGGRPKKKKSEPEIVGADDGEHEHEEKPAPVTLADLDISKAESMRAQKLAAIPESEFAQRISAIRERNDLLTTRKIISHGKETDFDGDEWRTPPEYIDKARKVLGVIDMDPASSAEANEVVKARTFFTKEDNGLAQKWSGNVWLNPPYSQPLVGEFLAKAITSYEEGDIKSAVILLNASTDTGWFHDLASRGAVACFTKGRIGFVNPSGKRVEGNRVGQVFFFLGCDRKFIRREFEDVGVLFEALGED